MAQKERNSILVRVAKLLRLSIQYSDVLSISNGTVKDYLVSLFDNTEMLNEYTSIQICIDDYFKLKDLGLINASSVVSSTITIIMGQIVPIAHLMTLT